MKLLGKSIYHGTTNCFTSNITELFDFEVSLFVHLGNIERLRIITVFPFDNSSIMTYTRTRISIHDSL